MHSKSSTKEATASSGSTLFLEIELLKESQSFSIAFGVALADRG